MLSDDAAKKISRRYIRMFIIQNERFAESIFPNIFSANYASQIFIYYAIMSSMFMILMLIYNTDNNKSLV